METIRDTIKVSYPNSPFLSLNDDQFSRLITGKTKITFSQETILQGYKLQSVSGTGAYNLFRSALPNSFPCSRTIRGKISNFCIYPGPIQSIIKLFSYRLKTYPSVNHKIIISFDEFSIAPKVQYSPQHHSYIGVPTILPECDNAVAENCLVFVAQCLTLPVRVPVSVDFTANSTKAGIIINIIKF